MTQPRQNTDIGEPAARRGGATDCDPRPPVPTDQRRVYVTAFGEPRCGCADGQYVDTAGQCRALYSTVGCTYRQQLRFNANFKLQCQPAVCPAERPVPFQGWCKNFGDVSLARGARLGRAGLPRSLPARRDESERLWHCSSIW